MPRHRAEPRKTLICRITVCWENEEGYITSQAGLLEDRSRSGVGITVLDPIAIGAKVRIRGRVQELAGTVRHCRLKGAKYFIGIQLEHEDATWNRFGVGL